MAVVSVKEQWQDRQAEGDFERIGLVRRWEVLTDSTEDHEGIVSVHEDLPVKGDPHPAYSYATVQNIVVERSGNPYMWYVTAIYGGGVASYEATKYIGDVEWDADEFQEDIDYDINGRAIVNTAGEPLEGVKATFFDQTLRITRTESAFNFGVARSYMRTLNAVPFLGAPPKCAFMGPIRARRIWELSGYIWRVSYEIRFRDNWAARVLNEGYRVIAGQNPDGSLKYKELTENGTEDGERVSKPVLLNASGSAPLAAGASPIWLYFDRYPIANWTPLQLEYS